MTAFYILAAGSAVFGIASFYVYIRDVLRGTTKPHPFSWCVWALINVVAFLAQLAGGGGVGAWISGLVVAGCVSVALLSLFKGERQITAIDWACFFGALLSMVMWWATNNPLAAIVFVTLTDGLAGIPTLRKAYARPHEETASAYALGVVSFVLQIAAFESLNLTTLMYPAFIVFLNGLIVLVILLRRKQLGGRSA